MVKTALERFGLARYFKLILGVDDVRKGKPHPDLMLRALHDLQVSRNEVVVIGDSATDVLMARLAGVEVCAVTWGAGTLQEVQDADWVVKAPAQLLGIM